MKIAIIGLGYVGLPLLYHFSKKIEVHGFDINPNQIKLLKQGIDITNEIKDKNFYKNSNINFTNNIEDIRNFDIYIVTVPTPVDDHNVPDLTALKNASKSLGTLIKKGSTIIYESTVYPGCTEEVCIPIIEKESGLTINKDFYCAYSPERINPGDKKHTLINTTKIISSSNSKSLKLIKYLYNKILSIPVYEAKSIKVAEAAKVIENVQRDLNIALINELSILFTKMDIKTSDVLEAAETKWNFLKFKPGLVGGHCIGVDPYYLTYKADMLKYNPQVILSGRRINDNMGRYYAKESIKYLLQNNINKKNIKIGILGFTFKEDCPDFRNSKVFDITDELLKYGQKPLMFDPYYHPSIFSQIIPDRYKKYIVIDIKKLQKLDLLIIAVKHKEFISMNENTINIMVNNKTVIYDIKNVWNRKKIVCKSYMGI